MIERRLSNRSRLIYRLLRPYKWAVVGFVALSFFAIALEGLAIAMLLPLMAALMPGNVAFGEDSALLKSITQTVNGLGLVETWHIGTLVVSLTLAKGLLTFSVLVSAVWLRNHFQRSLQLTLTDRYTRADYEYLSHQNMGMLIDLFVRRSDHASGVFMAMLLLLNSITATTIYFGMMIGVSWFLSFIVIIAGLGVTVVNSWAVRIARRSGLEAAEEEAVVASMAHGLLAGARIIRSFGLETQEQERGKELQDKIYSRRKRKAAARQITRPVTETALILCLVVLVVVTTEISGSASFASLAILAVILIRMMPHIAAINQQRALIASEFVYVEHVTDILLETEVSKLPNGNYKFHTLQQGLRLERVSFGYSGRNESALHDVTIEISAGSVTAIVGPSGSGKSTLLDLILRLYDPTSGFINVDGHDLKEFDVHSWRNGIGMVDQDGFLFNETIRTNIAYGNPDATLADIESALDQVHAHDFINELPNGLDTIVGDRGVLLSGGQQQRLTIARAIVRNPEILIFDEATSNLDAISEGLIQDAIKRLSQNRTVLIVAHRLSTVFDADKIIVLDKGCVVDEGIHKELISRKGLYATLYTESAMP